MSPGASAIKLMIANSGFSGRADFDFRPDAKFEGVVQKSASTVWGNTTIDILPFDAVVRSVELRVEPQVLTRPDEASRFAGLTAEDLVVGTSAVVSTSVSVGIMVWVLRGGSLLTAFMSATPVWAAFDPLPILLNRAEADPEDDETLLSMVKGSRKYLRSAAGRNFRDDIS